LSLIANQNISDSFLEMCSPVKFVHSLSKKTRAVSSWELCIICQISCDDTLSKAAKRGNVPYLKLLAWGKVMSIAVFMTNFDSLDLIPTDRIQYHRSCYESYTSKINLEKIWTSWSTNECLGENIIIYLCKDPLNDCSNWLVSMHIL
jgi:hypothetical protein